MHTLVQIGIFYHLNQCFNLINVIHSRLAFVVLLAVHVLQIECHLSLGIRDVGLDLLDLELDLLYVFLALIIIVHEITFVQFGTTLEVCDIVSMDLSPTSTSVKRVTCSMLIFMSLDFAFSSFSYSCARLVMS